MNRENKTLIAYILSGKNGITSFTFRELELLESKDIRFLLCFTQLKSSNNLPKKDWRYIVAAKRDVLLKSMLVMFSFSRIKLMIEAIKHNELLWFLIANAFSCNKYAKDISNIHVQMTNKKVVLGYYLNNLLRLQNLTCTIHAHELYSEFRYNETERFRHILNSCKKIFTISEFNRRILVEDLNISSEKISVMYLYPSFEADLSLRAKVKFLVTANWEKKKGYEEIVNAVKQLNRDDFVILIAGRNVNPDEGVDLTSIVKTEHLESKIILLGHLNMASLKLLYSMCDVFMLPSKTDYYENGLPRDREGIPVSIMEAMSFGLPVISTIHAGIPELVKEYLVPEGDTDALIQTMNNLIDEMKIHSKRSSENIDLVNTRFKDSNINVLINGILSD